MEQKAPDKDRANDTFTIRGDLRIESVSYQLTSQDRAAQVICWADVECNQHFFKNIQLLQLEIMGSSDEADWYIGEDFTRVLPYMKPVALFRNYLIQQLTRFRNTLPEDEIRSPGSALWMGIGQYISRLQNFREAKHLISQTRRGLDDIFHRMKRGDTGYSEELVQLKMMDILRCLEISPNTQRPFLAEKPVILH